MPTHTDTEVRKAVEALQDAVWRLNVVLPTEMQVADTELLVDLLRATKAVAGRWHHA